MCHCMCEVQKCGTRICCWVPYIGERGIITSHHDSVSGTSVRSSDTHVQLRACCGCVVCPTLTLASVIDTCAERWSKSQKSVQPTCVILATATVTLCCAGRFVPGTTDRATEKPGTGATDFTESLIHRSRLSTIPIGEQISIIANSFIQR